MAGRFLPDVIDKILEVIPKEEYDELNTRLKSIKDSAFYTAPEVMSMRWQQVGGALEELIGEPSEDWQHEIVKIMSGK